MFTVRHGTVGLLRTERTIGRMKHEDIKGAAGL